MMAPEELTGAFALSPPQFSSSQLDFSPPGFENAQVDDDEVFDEVFYPVAKRAGSPLFFTG
eukprot:1904936-Rhodomonas_salina.1